MKARLPPVYMICHKLDFFLTEIAVASIRYFYPDVEIYLIKDEISGSFSTNELESYFNVKPVRLVRRIFGWTSAKVFLLLSRELSGKQMLLLDSDVVFVGKILDKLAPYCEKYDFVVSPEFRDIPGDRNFSKFYYDPAKIEVLFPNVTFPGFTFNTGTIVITAGSFNEAEVQRFFDPTRYPYWSSEADELLPTRDQSLLNILLPLKVASKQITCGKLPMMWWCRDDEAKEVSLNDIREANHPFLIHWAGARRTRFLPAMERGDILLFFQRQYFARLPFGRFRFCLNLCLEVLRYYLYTSPRQLLGIDRIPDWMKDGDLES